jgi:hypothetical protein
MRNIKYTFIHSSNAFRTLLILLFYNSGIWAQPGSSGSGIFKGWEFLVWGIDKNTAETILNKKGFEIENTYGEKAYEKITRFNYKGMKTTLCFDSLNHLFNIEQIENFSVAQDKQAYAFYKKINDSLVKKLGKPQSYVNNKTKKIITIIWHLKFTRVVLVYDYRYKVVDEMGCCSYTVSVQNTPHSATLPEKKKPK